MDNPENKENKNIKINSENTTSEDSEKKQINKIKYQKNLDFIKEIINKYKFLENFKTGVSNLEKEENIYQLVDLFRIALILFDEKFNEEIKEYKSYKEKFEALKEEFNLDEYNKLKEDFQNILKENNELKSKYDDLLTKYQQIVEAYKNIKENYEGYVNRVEKNFEKMKREAKERIITNLVPVLDSFEISLKSINENVNDINTIKKGISLIYSQLLDVLKNEGMEIINSEGTKFDPSLHEAIEIVETDELEDETIIQEYRPAYKLLDKVIRPATVKVAKNPKNDKNQNN
ncbi:MAG: nucleotide exchange factor GrpE [bacterium]|nr:nucleotide exchange factor GrpE [bacterium]